MSLKRRLIMHDQHLIRDATFRIGQFDEPVFEYYRTDVDVKKSWILRYQWAQTYIDGI